MGLELFYVLKNFRNCKKIILNKIIDHKRFFKIGFKSQEVNQSLKARTILHPNLYKK